MAAPGYWGPTHGVANTFWNVRLSIGRHTAFPSPAVLDGVNDSSVAFIVGFTANVPVRIDYAGAVIEGTNRPGLSIPSLYAYQFTRRLRREVR